MAEDKLEELYQQHIKSLPPMERLTLVKLIADDLVKQPVGSVERVERGIMELHGLGKDIWAGIDPEKYVDELRKEWTSTQIH